MPKPGKLPKSIGCDKKCLCWETEVARAYFLADLPNGRLKAELVFAKLYQRELPPYSQLNALTIPMLLGDSKRVEQTSARLLTSSEPRIWAGMESVEFLAGKISNEELVAKAGKSNSHRQIAYWLIGLKCLGDGRRDMATHYFTACVDTGYFYTGICHWAKAFLARLERDPDWPDSIRRGGQIP